MEKGGFTYPSLNVGTTKYFLNCTKVEEESVRDRRRRREGLGRGESPGPKEKLQQQFGVKTLGPR